MTRVFKPLWYFGMIASQLAQRLQPRRTIAVSANLAQ